MQFKKFYLYRVLKVLVVKDKKPLHKKVHKIIRED